MTSNIARKFALALVLVALAAPLGGRAFAQSVNPTPNEVTGTDPEPPPLPGVVQAALLVLQLA